MVTPTSPRTGPGPRTGRGRAGRAAVYRPEPGRSDDPATAHDRSVLAEGVVVDARAVSFAVRMLSGLIDAVVVYALVAVLFAAVGASGLLGGSASGQAVTALVLGIVVLSLVVVPVTVETLTRGRSLGKLAMGVRIVRDDGGPVRFRQALVRGLLGVLELWMTAGGLAVVVAFCNDRGKRLGDLMAGTYAMRTRSGGVRTVPLVMPPYLAGWARTADVRPLPDGAALSARQMLARAPRLDPASRARLAQELASALEPYVAPGPPWGTPPEDFLAALLAERRDRDLVAATAAARRTAARRRTLHRLPWGLQDEVSPRWPGAR